MKKFYLLSLMSFVCLFVSKAQTQDNKSQTRMTGPFSKLIVNSPLKLTIIPGSEEKVVLTTDDPAFASFVNVNSNGSDLTIEVKNKPKNMNSGASITVYCKSLSNITINKQCDIIFSNKLNTKKLDIELNDKSKLNNASFAVSNLSINAKGGSHATVALDNSANVDVVAKAKSEVTITGNTEKLSIGASDYATVDASALQSPKIAVDCNNNSVITILCNDKFDANVNNNGKVQVKGNGQLNKKNIKNGGAVVQL